MRTARNDLVAGLVAVGLGGVGLAAAGSWDNNVWRFPLTVLVTMLVLGAMLLIRGAVAARRSPPATAATGDTGGGGGDDTDAGVHVDVTVVATAVVFALFLLRPLGFIGTGLLLTGTVTVYLAKREGTVSWLRVGLFCVGLVGLVYFLFVGVLNVNL